MVIIDTNNKKCVDCADEYKGRIWGGKCKECRHYDYLVRMYSGGKHYDYLRHIVKLHFKSGGYDSIVGCSQQEFKDHIESQFEYWMTWENRPHPYTKVKPKATWDLDHIIPWHTATTDKEKKKLCHYTNIQPLCSYENRYVKRGKTTVK